MAIYLHLSPGHMISAAVIFPFIGLVISGLRFYGRRNNQLKADDWLILPALISMIALCAMILWGVARKVVGYSEPEWDYPNEWYEAWGKTYWSAQWLTTLTLGFTKLSFVFFYRRIFKATRVFNALSIAMVVILIVWTIAFCLSIIFVCGKHISAYWTPSKKVQVQAGCMPLLNYYLAWTWSDVITDLILILMPIPYVLRLKMDWRKKLSLIGVFLLGTLSLIASTIRAVQVVYLFAIKLTQNFDRFMLYTNFEFWMLLETGLAFIAINLAVLYGLARREGLERRLKSLRSFMSLQSVRTGSQSSIYASTESSRGDAKGVVRINETQKFQANWYDP